MSENPPAPGTTDTSDQVAVRKSKRERLLARGEEAYPVSVPVTTTIAEVRSSYGHLEAGEETEDVVGVAGRVVFQRNTGKLAFITLQDGAGERLQIMASQAVIGKERLADLKADVDLGDHVFFHGRVGASRRGELSVFADAWQMAAKAVRPLPVLHAGLSEESRVRNRYVDLIVRQEARDTVRRRAEITHSLRASFHARRFVHGRVGASRRGELSVFADAWQMAAKAVRPLPVLHAGLSEESRVRNRYVDLIVRQEARDTVRRRAEIMHSLRASFHDRGFVEVETPMLQVIPSGAAARPF